MTDKTSKVANVTGGSRGLGRNTVLSLAARSSNSILPYNADHAEVKKVVNLVEETGRKTVAFQLDAADATSFGGFVDKDQDVLGVWGKERFEFLVNNVRTSDNKSFAQTREEELEASAVYTSLRDLFASLCRTTPLMAR